MLPLPIEELRDCAPDAIALTAGVKLRHEPHFLHPLFTEKTSDPTRAICQAILDATGITGVDRSKRGAVVQRAITSDMFGDISATASQLTVSTIMHSALADVRKLCQLREQPDYRASAFGILEVDEPPQGGTTESSNLEVWKVTASGEDIQIQDLVRLVVYSREILVNEGLSVIPATASAVGMAVARQLAQRFVSILEDNNDLSDGSALFVAGEGNLLTSGTLDLTALDASADALRSLQTTDGDLANVKPKFLLVPTSKEMSARVLVSTVNEAAPPEDQMEVIALPWLSDSYFYMLGNPIMAPAICLSTLSGSAGEIVRAERAPKTAYRASSHDGVAIRYRAPAGLAPVSRFVVRNTLA